MLAFVQKLPWSVVIVLCLTLGLAPFTPPHVWEKLQMLIGGRLSRPLDWFGLLLHGMPWVILIAKASVTLLAGSSR